MKQPLHEIADFYDAPGNDIGDFYESRPQDAEDYPNVKFSLAKAKCEEDHLYFMRYFFKARLSMKFIVNWHHRLMCDTVDKIISGEYENVVINLPPGGTKTETFVIGFIARGLALNPRARFLHLSGSNELASLNSSTARDVIQSDEFQAFWPMKIADDASAKKRWNVMVDGKLAGGVYATALGGQVTGFRAGHMVEGFQGAILIDDPIKPEDAFSRTKVDAANRKLLTTVKSRKANPKTPIVVVMQRVGENDPSGFILKGNLEGKWTHIKIPAILDPAYLETLLPKYRASIAPGQTVDGRFSYWPYKEPLQQLMEMECGTGADQNGQRISRHVFAGQYQQAPKALGGNIIHGKDFRRYQILPKIKYRKIYADTAQKTKEQNDYSVFEEWGLGIDGWLYLLNLIRGRWEAPELQRRAIAFWAAAKHRDVDLFGHCRKMKVEDKSSGTGLIQTIKYPPFNIPIEPIEREKDKLTRCMDSLPYIEAGFICIPEDAHYTNDFILEGEAFTADGSHDYDDQLDPMWDAIEDTFGSGNNLRIWGQLANEQRKETTATTAGSLADSLANVLNQLGPKSLRTGKTENPSEPDGRVPRPRRSLESGNPKDIKRLILQRYGRDPGAY